MFKGVIIEESLEDESIFNGLKVVSTEVEQVTENFKTPWLTQWTLHTIEVPDEQIASFAARVATAIDHEHQGSWFADFKSDTTHYIVFCDKVFVVDRSKKEEYAAATAYGISIGIPAHQINFSDQVI